MRVLMLGWEFPPFITGGLGTACYGLTKGLDAHGTQITFVLPKSARGATAEHVQLLSPEDSGVAIPAPASDVSASTTSSSSTSTRSVAPTVPTTESLSRDFQNTEFITVHGGFLHPYDPERADNPVGESSSTESRSADGRSQQGESADVPADAATRPSSGPTPAPAAHSRADSAPSPAQDHPTPRPVPTDDYSGDPVLLSERYAAFCIAAVTQRKLEFDIIHAHDWMTYPAGLAVARLTNKPLVVHIHSTEYDRSGESVNRRVYEIERRGMHGAMRVIAVSQLTKNIVVNRYGVPDKRVEVVYNGVEFEPNALGMTGIESKDKIVLYFGRITYQKGPEYFIRAAKRALEVRDDIKFVVAGSGDLAQRMMEMANTLGIGNHVLFTGFLRGKDINRVFAMADLYVMPSVSEPFGIAPLEAMSHDVPVIISKSSGVSEVLEHALKVDFWDIDDMANKIVAVLNHPPLSRMLREHGQMEVRKLTWDGAATRCEQIYNEVIGEMTKPPVKKVKDTIAQEAPAITTARKTSGPLSPGRGLG